MVWEESQTALRLGYVYSFPRYSAFFATLALYKMDHAAMSVGDEDRSAEPPTTVTATPKLSSQQLASPATLVAGQLASRTEGRMFPQLPTSSMQPKGPAVSTTPGTCSHDVRLSAGPIVRHYAVLLLTSDCDISWPGPVTACVV